MMKLSGVELSAKDLFLFLLLECSPLPFLENEEN